jgi:DNA-binding NtrC family response regulator
MTWTDREAAQVALVVDPTDDLADAVAVHLENAGFDPIIATTYELASGLLASVCSVSLLVCHHTLPSEPAPGSFVRRILEIRPFVPVVVIAEAPASDLLHMPAHWCFLQKPFDSAQLTAAVNRVQTKRTYVG